MAHHLTQGAIQRTVGTAIAEPVRAKAGRAKSEACGCGSRKQIRRITVAIVCLRVVCVLLFIRCILFYPILLLLPGQVPACLPRGEKLLKGCAPACSRCWEWVAAVAARCSGPHRSHWEAAQNSPQIALLERDNFLSLVQSV